MPYAPTKYNDIDLALKAERAIGAPKGDPVVRYAQQALVDLKIGLVNGKPLAVDGAFGPQTQAAILRFQEACGIPRSGRLDRQTYYQLDWRVYGLDGKSWKPAAKTLSSRGSAITKGHNTYLRPLVVVNSLGECREGMRMSDALEARVRRSLGFEGAVNRDARGTTRKSRHALSVAGDDMGDQDKDRIVEPDEIVARKAAWDFLIASCAGFPAVPMTMQQVLENGATSTINFTWRGHFRMVTQVIGNLSIGGGKYLFPDLPKRRDVSWSAARNTPKGSDNAVHVAPFHHHYDCAPGAPFGSPW